MKVEVAYLLDGTLRHDHHKAADITAKVLPDGRGYITLDQDTILYRHVERITLRRGRKARTKGRR